MMSLLCLVLCCIGFMHFSMANTKHFNAVTDKDLDDIAHGKIIFQLLGSSFLLIATWPAIAGWETEIGLVVWCGLMHVAAVMVSLFYTYLPGFVRVCWMWLMPGGLLQRAIAR